MRELDTRSCGRVKVDPNTFFYFEDGLFGFAEATEFVLLPGPENSPFEWLQATEIAELAFIVLKPSEVFSEEYLPVVAPSDLKKLQVEEVSECEIYTIVTIPEKNPKEMTANFQGPVLLNLQARLGRQVISLNDRHVVRVPILDGLEE